MEKYTSQAFRKYQVCPNPTSGDRSTELRKNDENKPKCWKIASDGYPAYHLCAQRLPNPYHEFLKSLHLFEEGNFIIRADWNLYQKTRRNDPECRKQPDYPISGSCSFLHRIQNRARSIPLESRQCMLSIDTNVNQIQASKDPQPSVQKRVLKGPKTHQNLAEIGKKKCVEQATREAHATLSCVELLYAALCYVRLSINITQISRQRKGNW